MIYLDPKEEQALKTLKKNLKEKLGDNFISLSLYGSKARGDYHKESDIDVLILLAKATSALERQVSDTAYDIESEYDFSIYLSPIVYGRKKYRELNNPPSSFMRTIKKDIIKV